MKSLSLQLVVAALLAVIGLIAFVVALDYELGSARRMGPGYFPVVLSGVLVVLAISEGISAVLKPDPNPPRLDWRPLVAILAAVAGFALAITLFGLIPAFVVVIGLTTLSERAYGWKPALILAGVTCLCAWLLFSKLLGMTLPLLHWGL